jgi:hypothetical protein
MPGYRRDPVSEYLDADARRLLARAYAHPGEWQATRLANPSLRARTHALEAGVATDLLGPDNTPAGGKGINARSRWMRGFIRSLYYQHRNYSRAGSDQSWERRTSPRNAGALQVQVGRAMPARGIIPAGRAIRIRLATGGQQKARAVRRLPDSHRIYDDSGRPAARNAGGQAAAGRDWNWTA